MLWFPALPELNTDACRATAQSVRQGAALVVVEGVANRAYHVWLGDVLKRLIATHRTLELFVDARQLRAYKPGVREEEAELILSFGEQLPAMHVLVRSRLRALGLTVVDLTLSGNVQAYGNPAKFQAALAPAPEPEVSAVHRSAPVSGRRLADTPALRWASEPPVSARRASENPARRWASEPPAPASGEALLGERGREAAGF